MPHTTKAKQRPARAKMAQRVRVRPFDSHYPEEICITQNLSRTGFYFETSLGHYFTGMFVYVTRNFHPGDFMSCAETADVVRVERLKSGKWGVAIRVLPGIGRR
jgi:hypothetical protein